VLRVASALLAAAVVLSALPANAAEHRVALIGDDAELLRALTLALSPWGVETVQVTAQLPRSSQPEAVLEAGELAAQFELDWVVWLSESPLGSLLWVYETRNRELTTRVLQEHSPLGSAAAASAALTVKTALRARVEPEPGPTPSAPVVPTAPSLTSSPPAPAPSASTSPAGVSLRAAASLQAVADHRAHGRLTLGGVVWLGAHRDTGLGLRLSGSSSVAVEAASFIGTYRDISFGPVAELRVLSGTRLAASLFVGGAVHASRIEGRLVRSDARAEARRYNASAQAGGHIEFKFGPGFLIGVGAEAAVLLGYPRYLVDGSPVFEPWRVTPAAGGHVGLELF
jgi:hypothetical protein